MRSVLLIMLALFAAEASNAQANVTAFRNDIGPIADVQVISDNLSCNVLGIQYRRQRSAMLAWRVSAGFSIFSGGVQKQPNIHLLEIRFIHAVLIKTSVALHWALGWKHKGSSIKSSTCMRLPTCG